MEKDEEKTNLWKGKERRLRKGRRRERERERSGIKIRNSEQACNKKQNTTNRLKSYSSNNIPYWHVTIPDRQSNHNARRNARPLRVTMRS